MTDVASTLVRAPSGVSSPKRFGIAAWTLDFVLLTAAISVAVALRNEGGVEALIGTGLGAIIGARCEPRRSQRIPAAISGAFAGLFGGALIAGFFHPLFAALFTHLF